MAIMADPPLLCDPLKNGKDTKGKIVVARRGSCPFSQKAMMAVMTGGAVGLFVIDSTQNMGLHMIGNWNQASPRGPGKACKVGGQPDGDPPACNPNPGIPVVALHKDTGDEIVALMETQSVSFEIKTAKIKPKDFEVLKKVYDSTLFISQAHSSLLHFGAGTIRWVLCAA